MGIFDHQHYWRLKDTSHSTGPLDKAISILKLEECSCGAVRTIEYAPGRAPVVRDAVKGEPNV